MKSMPGNTILSMILFISIVLIISTIGYLINLEFGNEIGFISIVIIWTILFTVVKRM